MNQLLLLCCFNFILSPDTNSITNYVPVEVIIPSGSHSHKLKVLIPSKGQLSLNSPEQVYDHVVSSWNSVVETHDAGLMDPKYGDMFSSGLSQTEAWHHYTAGQAGVVDSARFLITFSMVPSVQTGGSPLHIAASLGHLNRVKQLLEDGARVDEVKDDGNTALHCASTMGHVDIVQVLVEEGAFLEATGDSGATALMMAASMGHVEVVSVLLKAGANPDAKHTFGKTTALHFAAEVGRVEVIKKLCDSGADVEAEKTTGGTALHTAADANMTESVTVLVEHCGAKVDKLLMKDTTALYLAAQRGFTEVSQELIRLGANINFVMPRGQHRGDLITVSGDSGQSGYYPVKNTEVGNGATALHAAVENGHLQTVRMLLKNGALQGDSMEGATPLVIALQYKHPDIALLLLEDGWDDPKIDAKVPSDGSSALFVASLYGFEVVVKRLIERKAKINIRNRQGATSLSAALSNNHDAIVNILIDSGANLETDDKTEHSISALHTAVQTRNLNLVKKALSKYKTKTDQKSVLNSKGPDDQTPLHLAVSSTGPVSVVNYLLELGADTNCLVKSTLATPLHMAALRGRLDIMRSLMDHKARLQPRAGDSLYGATPLYLAAQNGHSQAVQLLLEAGVEVNCRLRQMEVTPLFIAAERGHTEVVRTLLKYKAAHNIRNWNGVTALGIAAMSNQKDIVKMLVAAGAEVNSRDNDGNSILLNCFNQENLSASQLNIIQHLLSSGADPNIRNNEKSFPLLSLAKKNDQDQKLNAKYAALLLENGAKPDLSKINEITRIRETSLSEAILHGNSELVKMLLLFNAPMNIPVTDEKNNIFTPLGAAVNKKNLELIELFLKTGELNCIFKEYSETYRNDLSDCVELAISTRNLEIIKLLTKSASYIGQKEEL